MTIFDLSRLTPKDVAEQKICYLLGEKGERLTFENLLERLHGIEEMVNVFKDCPQKFGSTCWQALKSLCEERPGGKKIVFREEREVGTPRFPSKVSYFYIPRGRG